MEVDTRFAEMPGQESFGAVPKIRARADGQRVHLRLGRRADAMEPPDLEMLDKAGPHLWRDGELPVGLAVIRGELGKEFIIGNPG